MDFSRLPDTAFLKIVEYLPLEDCIRIGRVDKSFRRIAQLATSRTKCLDLDEYRFRNLTADQLAVILDLCTSNLERIKLGGVFRFRDSIIIEQQKATTFSNYECPRLIEINLGYTLIDYADFAQLIRNNQNLETLVWKKPFIGYPPNITHTNLKKLNILVSNNDVLQSLIGCFPNLKELDSRMGPNIITANILDQFFGSIPQVNQVNLDIIEGDFAVMFYQVFRRLVSFWNLPLTSFSIRLPTGPFSGDGLLNLVTSFKHLQKLGLSESDISGGTLVNLLRSCPQLEHIVIREISGVTNSKKMSVFLESLVGIAQRHITLEFHTMDEAVKRIWNRGPVKLVIGKLEETGLKIEVIWVNSDMMVD